jgi:hypothetical protein
MLAAGSVADRRGRPVRRRRIPGRAAAPVAPDAFTVVVLSDTQNDCEKHPATFVAQIRWALDHKADRRIAALLQLGDITRITHAYHGSARLLPMDRACH